MTPKFLQKLKIEFYYLYRMLRDNRPLKQWIQYLNNRFFNRFLQAWVLPVRYSPDKNFELHILCQKSDIWTMIWAVKSFLYFSELKPQIVIHEDGSFTPSVTSEVKRLFPEAIIIFYRDADKSIKERHDLTNKLLEHRKRGHKLVLKLIDIFLLSKGDIVMVLDSDILFFKKPLEIMEFISGESGYQAVMSGIDNGQKKFGISVLNKYYGKYNLERRRAPFLNSGLILYRKNDLSERQLMEYFDNVLLRPGDYFVEMTGWCCLIAQLGYLLLPPDRYIIKGFPDDNIVMKHFTSARRHELYAYGINYVRNKIHE